MSIFLTHSWTFWHETWERRINARGILRVSLNDILARVGHSRARFGHLMSQLAVKDASIGIDSEVVKTFFEPFFTTKEWMSTGIDLVVVYGIEKNLREVSS